MSEEITIDPAIEKVSDFSDRVSPMMVKELRQGMRGISFVILFIAIQLVLAIYIFGASLADNYNNVGQEISQTIFFCISIAVLIVQPLRGLSAIATEIRENTIDLMVMTRLSAWRIAYGKWVSLMSQSALIVTAVAPYIILRYFLGGMNLFGELMILLTILIAAAGITAVMVGLSSISSLILRGLVGLGASALITAYCFEAFIDSNYEYRELLEFCSLSGGNDAGYIYGALVISTLYLGWLALDFGASIIAPLAENRATFRRIVSLVVILFTMGLLSFANEAYSLVFATAMAMPISIISITENPFLVPTITGPFQNKGILGRLSSWFFLPGWVTGLNYVMLLLVLLLATEISLYKSYSYTYYHSSYFVYIPTIFACLFFPLTLVRIFFRKTPHIFTFYLGAMTAMGVLFFILAFVAEQTRSMDIHNLFFWLPPEQFILSMYVDDYRNTAGMSLSTLTIMAYSTCFGYWLICAISGKGIWGHINQNMKLAQQINEENQTSQAKE